MQLIAPDILEDVLALSKGLNGFGYFVGVLLWLFGWRWHRFWVVWAITAGAGVIGLISGRAMGGHMLVAALLLAIAGGLLAIEIARLVTFVAGGLALWLGARAIMPSANDLTLFFVFGGLLSVLLYRFWTMLLTSFLGTLLACYCGLALAAAFLKVDALALATSKTLILNVAVIAVAFVGLCWQSFLERLGRGKHEPEAKPLPKPEKSAEDMLLEDEELPPPPKARKSSKTADKEKELPARRWNPFGRKAA